jgi:ribonuclease HI
MMTPEITTQETPNSFFTSSGTSPTINENLDETSSYQCLSHLPTAKNSIRNVPRRRQLSLSDGNRLEIFRTSADRGAASGGESTDLVKIFCDGLCEPINPNGYGCWGWIARDSLGNTVAQDYGCIGKGVGITSNVAEYHAVIESLKWLVRNRNVKVKQICADSLLVVNQINGKWKCKVLHLVPLRDEARALLDQSRATLHWIPREENQLADLLTRIAYKLAREGVDAQ